MGAGLRPEWASRMKHFSLRSRIPFGVATLLMLSFPVLYYGTIAVRSWLEPYVDGPYWHRYAAGVTVINLGSDLYLWADGEQSEPGLGDEAAHQHLTNLAQEACCVSERLAECKRSKARVQLLLSPERTMSLVRAWPLDQPPQGSMEETSVGLIRTTSTGSEPSHYYVLLPLALDETPFNPFHVIHPEEVDATEGERIARLLEAADGLWLTCDDLPR